MRVEDQPVHDLKLELLRRGRKTCMECPIAQKAAERVARHLLEQTVEKTRAYEPYAHVMGVCRGLVEPVYPSRQKICRHPDVGNGFNNDAAEDFTESIVEHIITAHSNG